MGIINDLFGNNKDENDSVYNRRKERGELPEKKAEQKSLKQQLEEQKRIVCQLEKQNRELREILADAFERLERAEYIHSMDDLIEAMRQEPERKVEYNPFASFIRTADFNGSGTSGSGADSSMDGNAFEPEQNCDVPDDAEYGDENTDIGDIGDDER